MIATYKDPSRIRKLNQNEVRLLWYVDFWDGPINGLCLCDNRKCWFEMLTDDEHDLPDVAQRRYLVVELTTEQLAEEERWHDLFRQKVGTHCDLEESRPEVRPDELHRDFYDAQKKRSKPDYSSSPVVGWFEMN